MWFIVMAVTLVTVQHGHPHSARFKIMERYFNNDAECADRGEFVERRILDKAKSAGVTARIAFRCEIGELRQS